MKFNINAPLYTMAQSVARMDRKICSRITIQTTKCIRYVDEELKSTGARCTHPFYISDFQVIIDSHCCITLVRDVRKSARPCNQVRDKGRLRSNLSVCSLMWLVLFFGLSSNTPPSNRNKEYLSKGQRISTPMSCY